MTRTSQDRQLVIVVVERRFLANAKNQMLLITLFTGSAVFGDYIEQLLQHCGRWPELNSVLVMDNASFHHTERNEQMYADAGSEARFPHVSL
jgi:hypothetical protein